MNRVSNRVFVCLCGWRHLSSLFAWWSLIAPFFVLGAHCVGLFHQQSVKLTFNVSEAARLYDAHGNAVSAAGDWLISLQYDGVDGVYQTNLTVTAHEHIG